MSSLPTELDFTANPAATPARMDEAMLFILAYLRRLESVQPDFLAAIAQLKAIGLERLDAVLSPIFVDAQDIAAQLDAIRTAFLSGAPLAQLLADLTAQVTAKIATVTAQLAAQDASVAQRFADNLTATNGRLATTDAKIAAQDAAVTQRLADNATAVAAQFAALGTMSSRAKALLADLFAWNADRGLTADVVGNAFAQQALAYAATLAWDWQGGFYRGPVSCTGNVTIATPSNIRPGETRILSLKGSDATARTVSFSSAFKGAVPQITDMTASKPYRLVIFADSATNLTADARALG